MRIDQLLFTLLFVSFLSGIAAQTPICGSLTEFAADECGNACVGCQMTGYQGSTAGFTSGGGSFCSGAVTEINSVWHGFIANATEMTFTVTSTNCTLGQGLQLAIIPGCGQEAIQCNPGVTNGATTPVMVTGNMVIGDTYFLLVNGRDGDVCNYSINVAPFNLLTPPPSINGPIYGPAQVCPGATVVYNVQISTNLVAYEWHTPPGSSINGTGLNEIIIPETEGPEIEVTFPAGSSGNGQIWVKGHGACGTTTPAITKNIQMIAVPPTVLPPAYYYPEDLPFAWEMDPSVSISNNGTYNLSTTFTSWLGCDSVVSQVIIVQPHPSGRVYWDMNNNNQYNPGTDIPVEGREITTSNGITAVTDADGAYYFPTLTAGTQILPGSLPTFATAIIPGVHTFQAGSFYNYNFVIKPQKGPASGGVYIDNDQNGTFNTGDTPVDNISIHTTLGQQTLSAADGTYQLNNVAYQENISVILPPDMELDGPGELAYLPSANTGYNFRVKFKAAYGFIWWDIDQSNSLTPGDIPAAGIPVTTSAGISTTTTGTGYFAFTGLPNGDTIRVVPPGVAVMPAFFVATAAAPVGGYQFLLSPSASAPDLSIEMTNLSLFRPGFQNKIYLTVQNNTTAYIPHATASFRFPAILDVLSTIPGASFTSNDSLFWDLGDLAPLESRVLKVTFYTPLAVPLGAVLYFESWVNPVAGDIDPSNNDDQLTLQVLGAFDPNDKQVDPAYVTPAMLAATKPFVYTIRFQNTGNYPADLVQITDTLSDLLDWSSIRFMASSHHCTWSISPEGVLKFYFPGINLPDSINNEPESHGFVKFVVTPKPGLEIGDAVNNHGDIYFDANLPIRTNTAQTHVVYFLPGTTIATGNKTLSVRPNPASFRVTFSWPDLTTADGLITLYSSMGLPVASVDLPAGTNLARINTSMLPDGIYLAVMEAGGQFYTRKVVILKEGPIRRE